ncbi:NAD(P)-dependent oxidoreductase [uncultured Desulfosarcina sp.]|uniref:NAD(P)-dependent oxidoreductase n=1 Tax=uncultured Desulfosarcina sp. TaxID=218289 RepID=UPI0029C6AFDE|nr:NAD(P)-dependent oxidoreductase [uncultured Desulfosarcina sp.]
MSQPPWQIHNPEGTFRVIVTKALPGRRWLDILIAADCRIEVCHSTAVLDTETIKAAIGSRCDGGIGQLTEPWNETLFDALKAAGGIAYSNYAVGYNNVDLEAATRAGIPVGNTPGVLTETTAEMAVALTFAAARRVGEAERYLRAGRYTGWLPDLFLGTLLQGRTLGIIGAGRIGSAFARMMVQGHGMQVIYHDLAANTGLESFVAGYNRFRVTQHQSPVVCRRAASVDSLLETADCVSIHTVLDETTHHLIDARRLALMKPDAILINTSRGPVVDEAALVDHCRRHPDFRAGLDVFEHEPETAPGLAELDNVVIVPHIASATRWTREGMATLAACNVAGLLSGYPLWQQPGILPFLEDDPPHAIPSIVNAGALGWLGKRE